MTDDRGIELARLIDESPDDTEAFRVYADYLEGIGDPRATLIRLQMTRARLEDRTKLEHLEIRLAELLERHREDFLGPLAKVLPSARSSKVTREGGPQLEWRNGFVYKADLQKIKRMPMHRLLDHLLAHPSGRFLVELRGLHAEDPAGMVAVLAARAPRSLRRLEISGTDGSKATSIASIWPRLEHLEEIEISNVTALGEIVLPNLVRATIDISDPALLASLATAHWPKLARLRLRISPEKATADQVLAVFENQLPALRSVELQFDRPTAALLPMLAQLSVGKCLTELEVRGSTEIVEALTRCRFQLDVLRLGGMSPDPRPRLAHLAKQLELT